MRWAPPACDRRQGNAPGAACTIAFNGSMRAGNMAGNPLFAFVK
jgi:hypothetical protein